MLPAKIKLANLLFDPLKARKASPHVPLFRCWNARGEIRRRFSAASLRVDRRRERVGIGVVAFFQPLLRIAVTLLVGGLGRALAR